MKAATIWKILGAAAAFVMLHLVRQRFGTGAAVLVLVLLVLGWWLLHLYYKRRLGELRSQFQQLDAHQKAQALSELDPEICKDIEKRIANKRQG
jgi:hypothetical protein